MTLISKPAATIAPIHELLANRWSPRAFDPDRPVSQAMLLALLEAARWSASCFNDQPWRLIVCDKTTNPDSWQQALAVINEKNQRWAKNAPLLMLAVAMHNFNHNGQPNRWAQYDTGAAMANLTVQATALGLAAHQMGGFDADKARLSFQLPDECTPMAMLAVGYQAPAASLEEDFQAAEIAERQRAKLAERFFAGVWGVEIQ